MGVHGLWKLIDKAGRPIPVETLEGKVLAIGILLFKVLNGRQVLDQNTCYPSYSSYSSMVVTNHTLTTGGFGGWLSKKMLADVST